MEFTTNTRIALVTGPGPVIAGTVLGNDGDGDVVIRLDSGEIIQVTPGDLYPLT